MSAHDALKLIDERVRSLRSGPEILLGKDGAADMLELVRAVLVEGPFWSEVTESKLRAELDEARADVAHMQLVLEDRTGSRDAWRDDAIRLRGELREYRISTELAGALFGAALGETRAERNRARLTAVRLEQELARARSGAA